MELFACKQAERETHQEYWRWFVHLRATTLRITDEAVILIVVNGLRPGPYSSRLTKKLAKKYNRADIDLQMKTKAQTTQPRQPPRPQLQNQYPRNDLIKCQCY